MIEVPLRFDSAKFQEKYKDIVPLIFWINPEGFFECPSIPELQTSDLLDCVHLEVPTIAERLEAAELMIDLMLDTQQEVA